MLSASECMSDAAGCVDVASRDKRKPGHKPGQVFANVRKTGEGEQSFEYSIDLQSLPIPEAEFYCHSAMLVRRPNIASFFFGQHGMSSAHIPTAVAVDVPYRCFPPVLKSMTPEFRGTLEKLVASMEAVEEFKIIGKDAHTLTYPGHFVRLLVNDFASVFDFYELLPANTPPPTVVPVIRIKSVPPLMRWFVEACDGILAVDPEPDDSPSPT